MCEFPRTNGLKGESENTCPLTNIVSEMSELFAFVRIPEVPVGSRLIKVTI